MCGICGCGQTGIPANFQPVAGKPNHVLKPHHSGQHQPRQDENERMLKIEQDLLGKNSTYAAQNRRFFQQHSIFALNLVSSPGAGKTTILVETIKRLTDRFPIAVIEGDQQTELDADRIRATGAPAVQINTGRVCHLEAKMIGEAVGRLSVQDSSLLFIENVGNLVCPAAFDLGEAHKVAVLSVTEGDDKPLKYPDMFHAAGLMLINKTDLLPYVDFDIERCAGLARQVNPNIEIISLSAAKGDNFSAWTDWLYKNHVWFTEKMPDLPKSSQRKLTVAENQNR